MEEVRSGGKLGVTFSILVAILEWHQLFKSTTFRSTQHSSPYFLKVCNLGFLWFEPYSLSVFCIATEVLHQA